MTRDEAVNIIANRLGQRTGLTSQIIAEMKLAQTRLEHGGFLPWFLRIKYDATFDTSPIYMQDGFLREIEDIPMIAYADDDGIMREVQKDYYSTLVTATANGDLDETGPPEYYAMRDATFIHLFPVPDKAYTGTTNYYQAAATLSTDIENLWLKHVPEVLICETGIRIAKFLRDEVAVALFKEDLASATDDMIRDTVAFNVGAFSAKLGGG